MIKGLRVPLTVSVGVLATAVIVLGTQQNPQESEVDALKREHRDVLMLLVKTVEHRSSTGLTDTLDVLEAKHQLLKAELQMVSSPEQRIEALQNIVVNLQEIEAILDGRNHSGTATVEEALGAKSKRLKAAIRLAEAQALQR